MQVKGNKKFLGAVVAAPTPSTNSVQVTPQMCVNPRANLRMRRRLWIYWGHGRRSRSNVTSAMTQSVQRIFLPCATDRLEYLIGTSSMA